MGEALVITSGKGGVGKSTLAVNLAVALAGMECRTVLIDADTGLRSLDVLLGLENNVVYDLTDVAEGACRLRQAVLKHREIPRLALVAAAQLRDSSSVTPERMEKIVGELKDEFDEVIIDCPAGVDNGFRVATAGADRAVVVVQNDPICVRDAERVKGLLERADVARVDFCVNRAQPEPVQEGPSSLDQLAERLEMKCIGAVPEDSAAFLQAARSGKPVALGAGALAQVFRDIARRVRGEDVPVSPVRRPSIWSRLLRRIR